ncbi:MAG: class I adenylate-forming enzyme family protein [Haloarculaceae archaeon]
MRDWLAHRARATPGATALVAPDTARATGGGESSGRAGGPAAAGRGEPGGISYERLDARVEELAGRLSGFGVGVDDHLAVCLPTRPAVVTLAHAAMRLDAVLVPLHPELTAPELADRIERAEVTHAVAGRGTEATVAAAVRETGLAVSVATVDEPDAGAAALSRVEPEVFDLSAWDHDCPLLLVATSGTTGTPKLVELTAGNLHANAAATAWRLGVLPTDRWHCVLPMAHVGGLAPVYRTVLYGTAVVVEDVAGGFDATATLRAMQEGDATCVSLVPATLRRLLDASADPDAHAFPDLRFVLLGGAAAPESLVERAADRGVPVATTYGTTETASGIATARPEEAREAPGTVGSPLMFTDVTVVDGDGVECDPGDPGEFVVRGPAVASGYYGDAAATERAFSSEGFHTGDVGYRDRNGRLWVLNRLDDRITTGGETVDPGEVADAIRSHPEVADAFVLGIPDETFGERVAALVEPEGTGPTTEALDAYLRERLAGFKLPRTVAFGELPRTASGTVEREAARERLLDARDEGG